VRGFDEFLGMGMVAGWMFVLVIPTLLLGLAIPYAVLRMREGKTGETDPQIGLKSALHFFCSAGILMVLFGLTIIFIDLFLREDRPRGAPPDESRAIRTGVGIMVSGFCFAVLHGLLLTGTNDRKLPATRRAFTGARFAIHGMVVLFSLTALIVSLCLPNLDFRTLKPYLATLLVWGPSWIVHMILLIVGTPRLRVTRESLGLDET
jgi:hypothetical protein